MQEFTTAEFVFFCAIVLFIQYVIIRLAVSHGNNSTFKDKHLWMQTNLFIKMARKQGVSEEEIQEAIKN
jgi:uncharacterized protein (DUF1919 family)